MSNVDKRAQLKRLGEQLMAALETRAETSAAVLLVGSALVAIAAACACEICDSIDSLKESKGP